MIVVYGSSYGTAKKYAKKLSKSLDVEAKSFLEVSNLDDYKTIIYIGALYAGGVSGLAKSFKHLSNLEDKKIIICTVGLSDPKDKVNSDNIKNKIKKQLKKEVHDKVEIFHLRGAIDYSKLSMGHKILMKLVYLRAKRISDEDKTEEVKALIKTYNKKVDFVDFASLDPIIKAVGKKKKVKDKDV